MANKMRSGLSTLGIMIGMTSVIVMMAIGQGAESSLMKEMGDLVKNKITVRSDGGYNRWDNEFDKPGAYVKKVTFTPEIIEYIEHYFPELKGRMTYGIHG
ncbi:MAG: ABC transporter permease [bacterium]|nr:ABC transporter permease [bacterium]